MVQSEQLGTGHAVAQALPDLPDDARVLVLYGDVPLTRVETLEAMVAELDERTLGLLTVTLNDPAGYGRIVRNGDDQVTSIVEQKTLPRPSSLYRRSTLASWRCQPST